MTDAPSMADAIRETVKKARAIMRERGGMDFDGETANENKPPSSAAPKEETDHR